jgi:hypothetical protein
MTKSLDEKTVQAVTTQLAGMRAPAGDHAKLLADLGERCGLEGWLVGELRGYAEMMRQVTELEAVLRSTKRAARDRWALVQDYAKSPVQQPDIFDDLQDDSDAPEEVPQEIVDRVDQVEEEGAARPDVLHALQWLSWWEPEFEQAVFGATQKELVSSIKDHSRKACDEDDRMAVVRMASKADEERYEISGNLDNHSSPTLKTLEEFVRHCRVEHLVDCREWFESVFKADDETFRRHNILARPKGLDYSKWTFAILGLLYAKTVQDITETEARRLCFIGDQMQSLEEAGYCVCWAKRVPNAITWARRWVKKLDEDSQEMPPVAKASSRKNNKRKATATHDKKGV